MIGPGGAAGALSVGRGRFSAKVDAAAGVSPIFEDDFESYTPDAGAVPDKTQNGYGWGPATGTVEVSTDQAFEGTQSLKITHAGQADGGDSNDHMNFKFNGAQLTEVWTDIRIYIPLNYQHREQSGSDNNKLFQLWADERSSPDKLSFIIELINALATVTGDSDFRPVYDTNDQVSTTILTTADFITDTERGQWNRLQVHVKVGTFDNNDGQIAVMWNGVTWLDRTSIDYYKDPNGGLGSANYIDNGRFLGWANSGFAEDTSFYFDDFKVHDSDPGW